MIIKVERSDNIMPLGLIIIQDKASVSSAHPHTHLYKLWYSERPNLLFDHRLQLLYNVFLRLLYMVLKRDICIHTCNIRYEYCKQIQICLRILKAITYQTRSTRRAQTSLAEADHYSHISQCNNVEPWW